MELVRGSLNSESAKELFASSAYLLQDVMDIAAEAKYILKPVREQFTEVTEKSLIEMLAAVATHDHSVSTEQQKLIDSVKSELSRKNTEPSHWN